MPRGISARLGTIIAMGSDIEHRPLLEGEAHLERLAVRLPEASYISGLSRSELYRRAARDEVIFLKCGASTLVDLKSLRALVASLPRAKIKTNVRPRAPGGRRRGTQKLRGLSCLLSK
jgi:hypothetical protein